MSKPEINVTPLIDVLLVLLIIFMVITPLKPSVFKSQVPSEPAKTENVTPNPDTLVVSIGNDASIAVNQEPKIASTVETEPLVTRLKTIFAERIANGSVRSNDSLDADRPYSDKAERTVFINAPKKVAYGTIARVVDAVKLGGAYPISLQIDDLK